MHPWCNNFLLPDQVGKEPYYPLRVLFCHDCGTAQLDYTVPKETMFGNHTYLSGVTRSLSAHFRTIANDSVTRFFPSDSRVGLAVLDIGSNDGTQLKHFKELGCEVLGVESSKVTAQIAQESGVETLNRFFNYNLVKEFGRKFKIINAGGVFFHLEELHSATKGVKLALDSDGVFIVQFLYMKRIVENVAFDQIYHEHLLYYNLRTLGTLLERHGLEIFDAYLAPIHGGSMIAYVSHSERNLGHTDRLKALFKEEDSSKANTIDTYLGFSRQISELKKSNLQYLGEKKAGGKTIYGMGAPVKGNTLLNYFGVGTKYLTYLVEKNPLRNGLISPGMHIPVVMEDDDLTPPDVYYVLAWNFKKEILENNSHLIKKGIEFYFPISPIEV